MKILNSSTILDIDYNAIMKKLIITFISGARYQYQPIDATTHTRFMNAESKGKFHLEFIKNNKKISVIKLPSVENGLPRENSKVSGTAKSAKIIPIHQISRDFHKLKNKA